MRDRGSSGFALPHDGLAARRVPRTPNTAPGPFGRRSRRYRVGPLLAPLRRASHLSRVAAWVATRQEPRDGCIVSQTFSIPSSSAGDSVDQRLNVLVVEDDELSLDIITRWLRRRGCPDVRGVADGPAGLAACFQRLPDLLILDHRIPGLSGLAIAEHLRMNFPREQRPWTVLFSAACNSIILNLMATGNFDDLLRKPCIGEDYIGMITRARGGLHERRSSAGHVASRSATLYPRVAL